GSVPRLRAQLLFEFGRETAAEDGVDDANRDTIGIVGRNARVAESEIDLRCVRLVYEEESLPFYGCGRRNRFRLHGSRRPRAEGLLELGLHLIHVEFAGDPDNR